MLHTAGDGRTSEPAGGAGAGTRRDDRLAFAATRQNIIPISTTVIIFEKGRTVPGQARLTQLRWPTRHSRSSCTARRQSFDTGRLVGASGNHVQDRGHAWRIERRASETGLLSVLATCHSAELTRDEANYEVGPHPRPHPLWPLHRCRFAAEDRAGDQREFKDEGREGENLGPKVGRWSQPAASGGSG